MMKKYMSIVVVMAMFLLMFAACGADKIDDLGETIPFAADDSEQTVAEKNTGGYFENELERDEPENVTQELQQEIIPDHATQTEEATDSGS